MSRFSFASLVGRKSTTSDPDADLRPSIVSTVNLNARLSMEGKDVDQHLFFGPLQAVFDGDRTRVIHGERKIQKNARRFWLTSEPLSMDRDSTTSLIGFPSEAPPKQGLASTISAAGRFIGQKVAQMKFPPNHVNEDSFCDGCGMDPIVGNMYTCSRCENYSLCEGCYQSGIHGFEESPLLKDVREDFAVRNVMDKSKHRVPEKVFSVLLHKVCRGQVDKFNFLATWITAVVLDHPIHELSVRGIAIPHLDAETRTTLVELLTPVLAERTDLEVCMEWFQPDADNEELPNSKRREETLRIWVATDKDSKSPFVTSNKDTKDADTESDLSPTSGSAGDLLHSPGPVSPNESDSPSNTPPPSPVAARSPHAQFSPKSSTLASQLEKLAVEAQDEAQAEDEDYLSDSVMSDIAPTKVDSVSASGEPSAGMAM